MKKLAGILVLLASGSVAAEPAGTSTTGRDARAAIAYWTTGYAGAELADVECPAPAVPDAPQDSRELLQVDLAIKRWQDCHRRVIGALQPAQAGKTIPAEVLAAMTPDERALALRHVASVHERVATAVQLQAAPVIARHEAWRDKATRFADQLRAERAELYAHARDREDSKAAAKR